MDTTKPAVDTVAHGELRESCREAARTLLRDCVSPWGLAASGSRGEYHNLWARDTMITALGIIAEQDPELLAAVRTTLLSLAEHQTELGLIPNKIDFGTKKRVNFRAYADGGLWFVITTARYLAAVPTDPASDLLLAAAEKALVFYRYQDHDCSGLVAIDEGATWMDLFPLRGKSVYINILRYQASQELARVLAARQPKTSAILNTEAEQIAAAIQEKLWYEPGKDIARLIQDSFSTSAYDENGYDSLGRKLLLPEKKILTEDAYFLPYLTLRDFGEWFDTLGNLLTITSGLATPVQQASILSCIEKYQLAAPFPIKAIYPTLQKGDADWRYYFQFANLNTPEEYHNGGSWPFIGGWYVAALAASGKTDQAAHMLDTLAKANLDATGSGFSFNEHRHGTTGSPLGMKDQAWSAGMYLFAYHAVFGEK